MSQMGEGGAGGKEVGRVSIRVVPDLSRFRAELETELRAAINKARAQVKVDIDTSHFIKQYAALRELVKDKPLEAKIEVNAAKFYVEVEKAVAAAGKKTVGVDLDAKTAEFYSDIRTTLKAIERSMAASLALKITGQNKAMLEALGFQKIVQRAMNRRPITTRVEVQPARASFRRVERQIDGSLASITKSIKRFVAGGGNEFEGESKRLRNSVGDMAPALLGLGYTFAALAPQVLSLGYDLSRLGGVLATIPAAIGSLGAVAITTGIAFAGMKDAMKNMGDAKEFNKSLKNLSPNARAFAVEMRKLRPQLSAIRKQVQDRFFAGLDKDLARLGRATLPAARKGMSKVADALGGIASAMIRYTASAKGARIISTVFKNTARATKESYSTTLSLADGLGRLAQTGSTLLPGLARQLSIVAADFDVMTKNGQRTGQLKKYMEDGFVAAGQLARGLWDAGAAIAALGKAAQDAGGPTLKGFADSMAWLRSVVESPQFQKAAVTIFSGINRALNQIKSVIPGAIGAFESLAPAISSVADLIGGLFARSVKFVADSLKKWAPSINKFVKDIDGPFRQAVDGAFGALDRLATVIKNNPVLLAGLGVALLHVAGPIGDIVLIGGLLVGAFNALGPVFAQVKVWFQPVIDAFMAAKPTFDQFGATINSLVASVGPTFKKTFSDMGPLLASVKDDAVRLGTDIVGLAQGFLSALGPALKVVGPLIVWFASVALKGIVIFVTQVIAFVINLADFIVRIFRGDIGGAFKALGRAIFNVLAAVAGLFTAFVGIVGGHIATVATVVGSALFNMGKKLVGDMLKVGGDMARGLGNGISGAYHYVIDAAKSLANKLPEWVRKVLDINSPSRVMARLGRYVTQGFYQGILKNADKVKAAAQQLSNKVKDAFAAHKLSRSAELAALKTIDESTKRLQKIAKQRDKVADQLKAANDKLKDKLSIRNDYAAQVRDEALGYGSFTSGDAANAASMIQSMKDRVAVTQKYIDMLRRLLKMGLNDTTYKEIVDKGVESGTALAQSLLTGGQTAVSQVNGLQKQLDAAAKQLGSDSSRQLYQAGVDAAQGIVDGIQSRYDELAKTMRSLARHLVRTLKKELGIHSPSRVTRKEVGRPMGDGVELGVLDTAPAIDAALSKVTSFTASAAAGHGSAGRSVPAVSIGTIVAADPDEVSRKIARRQRDIAALYNLGGVV